MDSTVVTWATGAVATAVATVAGVLGGRRISRNAANVTQNVDPNVELVNMLAKAERRIDRLEADNSHGKVRISDVERDLASEREHSMQQDRVLASLQDENRQQRQQLSILRRALEGWEAWHRLLIAKWDEFRQDDAPPDAPQLAPDAD